MNAEQDYRNAVADLEATQRKLGATSRSDVEARAAATRDVEAATARVRDAKEAVKRGNMRRNFAGVNGPLWEACVERFPPELVRELEDRALALQAEREARSAERRAKQPPAPAAPKPPTPRPSPPRMQAAPEVFVRRAGGTRP